MIGSQNHGFGFRVVFDIHFVEFHTALFEEVLGAAAIWAPAGAVDGDGFHMGSQPTLVSRHLDTVVLPGNLNANNGSLQSDGGAVPVDVGVIRSKALLGSGFRGFRTG